MGGQIIGEGRTMPPMPSASILLTIIRLKFNVHFSSGVLCNWCCRTAFSDGDTLRYFKGRKVLLANRMDSVQNLLQKLKLTDDHKNRTNYLSYYE